MRKIISREQAAKTKKRNNLILAGILIIIMFGSVFAVIVGSFGNNSNTDEKVTYKGYEFVSSNGFWTTKIGDYSFAFQYNPEQVEKVSSTVDYSNKYQGKTLYFSSENPYAISEIYRNLDQIVGRFQEACLNETGCKENLPIKNCSNNFIVIRESNFTNILQDENCVFIEGNFENLTSITDEFLFKTLGVED
jgi:hypothetical protein